MEILHLDQSAWAAVLHAVNEAEACVCVCLRVSCPVAVGECVYVRERACVCVLEWASVDS